MHSVVRGQKGKQDNLKALQVKKEDLQEQVDHIV
jgi:hypothetical protein